MSIEVQKTGGEHFEGMQSWTKTGELHHDLAWIAIPLDLRDTIRNCVMCQKDWAVRQSPATLSLEEAA